MARFIASYTNDSAIQEAVDNKTLGKPYVALNEQTGEIDWNGKEETDYSKMYFTFVPLATGSYMFRCWETEKKYSYSINDGEWVEISGIKTISLSFGDNVRFKSTEAIDGLFDGISKNFNVYGNILSLKYGDNFMGKKDVHKLSFVSSKVVDASNLVLPATSLTRNAYDSMFMNCRSLTAAPELPATILASFCYNNMFYGCTSLATAPALPATNLASYCYSYMFAGCSSLNYIKSECLNPTYIYIDGPTESWLDGVSPTGTFVKKAGVEWPTGASGIPDGWTVIEE